MKTLLFLLAFLPLACSSEDPVQEEPQPEITLYFLELAPECNRVNVNEIQVTEETYKSVMGMHEIGDCETFHHIPDIQEEVHSGYLMGESKEP